MVIDGGKFLTFILGQEIYGLPIKKAKEIIGMMEVTHIPKTQRSISRESLIYGARLFLSLICVYGLEWRKKNIQTVLVSS